MIPDAHSNTSQQTRKTEDSEASTSAPKVAAPHAVDTKAPKLRIERVFNTTPENLWTYWTDPKKYAKWLSPQKADLVIHEWDLRVGGRVKFDMPLDNGQVNKEEGVFHVLDKTKHLVSGSADKSFLLDVTFTAVDSKRTRMTVLITGVPAEYHGMATEGWGKGLDKLAEQVEVPGPGEGFRLVRHFNAPTKKVWDMWTTAAGLDKWWKLAAKDMGFDFKVIKLDVRVGGGYDLMMKNKEHGELHNHGVYTEVVPSKRLAQRWNFDIFLALGEKPYPIAITVDFEEIDTMGPGSPKGTKMTFTQGPMAKPDFTEGSRQGVISNFAKMEKALAG